MYFYIYDSFLKEKKYQKIISKIESRLVDLGIKGKILRLNMLKNVNEIIKEEVARGVHTVVVVGDDKTFNLAIESAIKNNIVLGYIPLEKTYLGEIFGIPVGELACDILSGRIIEKINIGKINQKFFINSVIIEKSKNLKLKIDSFKIKTTDQDKIIIKNLNTQKNKSSVNNKNLDLFIEKPGSLFNKNNTHSLFTAQKIEINSSGDYQNAIFDDFQSINTPLSISIASEKLKMIVGSERKI